MNLLLWKSKRLVYDFKSVYPNKSIQNNQYSIIVMCLVTWDHSGNLPQGFRGDWRFLKILSTEVIWTDFSRGVDSISCKFFSFLVFFVEQTLHVQ